MKIFSIAVIVSFISLLAQARADETRESLFKFFSENMPAAVWPPQVEQDFTAFLEGEPSTGSFVYKSSFSSPGVPSALILNQPRKKVCGYIYDDLRIAEYKYGGWRDMMSRNPEDGMPGPSDALRRKDEYCVNFSMLDLPEERKLLIRNYVNGIMKYPWVYDNDGDYQPLFDSLPVNGGIIYEWFSHYFPDNSAGWPERALRTLKSPPRRAFVWKGDLLNTGNPTVLMLVDKDAPTSLVGDATDKDKHISYSGRDYFYEITIMEYRKAWKGWRERLSIGEKVYIDGAFAGYPAIDPRDRCLHMTFLYHKERKNIGVCSEIVPDCLPKEEIVHCAKYRRSDKFDASSFTKSVRPTRD